GDAPVMPFIDDRGVVRIAGQRRIEFLHCRCGQAGELFEPALGDEDIVRCDAGLAGIQELAVDNAFDRFWQGGVLAQDAWRFAAEFERHRRQVLGGGLHDQAAGGLWSRYTTNDRTEAWRRPDRSPARRRWSRLARKETARQEARPGNSR